MFEKEVNMLYWRNNIHTWKTVLEERQASQYKMPEIRIVSTLEKQDIDELHDMVVSFLVDKVFKDKDCHVVKWKGNTYIRLKEDVRPIKLHLKKRDLPKKEKDCGISENDRPCIADEYSRNSSRYHVDGKGKKRG